MEINKNLLQIAWRMPGSGQLIPGEYEARIRAVKIVMNRNYQPARDDTVDRTLLEFDLEILHDGKEKRIKYYTSQIYDADSSLKKLLEACGYPADRDTVERLTEYDLMRKEIKIQIESKENKYKITKISSLT